MVWSRLVEPIQRFASVFSPLPSPARTRNAQVQSSLAGARGTTKTNRTSADQYEDLRLKRRLPAMVLDENSMMISAARIFEDLETEQPQKRVGLFDDTEIWRVHVHPKDYQFSIGPLRYGETFGGKAVAQQMDWQSSAETCMAMILLDQGKHPNVDAMIRNGSQSWNRDDLKSIGKGIKFRSVPLADLPDVQMGKLIEDQIKKHGSGILVLLSEIGQHYVIVDSFNTKNGLARIRDPFHGWSITVTTKAILKRFPSELIQFDGMVSEAA